MTSFAGSKLNIDVPKLASAGKGGSYGGAASAAGSVGDAYGALSKKGVKADEIYGTGMKVKAEEQAAAWNASAAVNAAGVKTVGAVMGKKLEADAAIKAAKAAAAAQGKAGAMGAIGSIVGAGIGLFSDERTKHTIEKLDDVTLMLRELNPVSFYYKSDYTDDTQRKHYGFIAQEYKEVMPEATHYDPDSGMLRIDINQLIALLVKGYQQLDNRVTRMEAKNVLVGVN